jgi:hypothetical protein
MLPTTTSDKLVPSIATSVCANPDGEITNARNKAKMLDDIFFIIVFFME